MPDEDFQIVAIAIAAIAAQEVVPVLPKQPGQAVPRHGRVRVVDGSLMPDAVRANLQFTIYMMAERISAVMRHDGDLQAALEEAHAKLAA